MGESRRRAAECFVARVFNVSEGSAIEAVVAGFEQKLRNGAECAVIQRDLSGISGGVRQVSWIYRKKKGSQTTNFHLQLNQSGKGKRKTSRQHKTAPKKTAQEPGRGSYRKAVKEETEKATQGTGTSTQQMGGEPVTGTAQGNNQGDT
ncbi:hypothetical protein MA16_Dca009849 [Dendrobium catenatum]|uniref:Uncharacterized protein n=1 Tax=Dendrobium catenatum TaxID=906689 RepID=A0A2I0VKD6_9ASPA|nr:hypothetical protein MA16_Dca009849 [Dendrobium catenatum]